MRGREPARLHDVPSYEDKALCQSRRFESDFRKDGLRGRAPGWGCGFAEASVGGRGRTSGPRQGSGSCGGPAGSGRGGLHGVLEGGFRMQGAEAVRGPHSQPAFARLCSGAEADHNLSVLRSLQPHLPPHLSKQGKELQTRQSPSLAAPESCQGSAGARAPPSPGWGAPGRGGGPPRGGEEGRGCGSPPCLS